MYKMYIVLVALVAIAGLFVALKYAAPQHTQQKPQAKAFNLIVQNRKLISGPSVLTVNQDDPVTINITVDEDEELHLHGYNLHIDLEKGKPGSLSFVASTSGRFPYELEHSSTDIGALEVQPK